MKHRALLCLVAASVIGAGSIQAYVTTLNEQGISMRWFLSTPYFLVPKNSVNQATKALRIFLHEEAFSDTNRAAELNAIRSAFDQWQSIPETSIRFEDAGLISGEVDINTSDRTNLVYWAKTSTLVNGQTTDIRWRLGTTFTSGFINVPAFAESDIVLNGVEHDWYTDYTMKEDPRQYVEGVVLHEIGHMLGLSHSTIGGATMIFDTGGSGVAAVVGLSTDEIAFASQAYGTPTALETKGTVTGLITKEGTPVYGASIVLENELGAIITGGISRQESSEGPDGHYFIKGVPTGKYHLRVFPLQPRSSGDWLISPEDIPLPNRKEADTNFLPSTVIPITVTAGQSSTVDVAVEPGELPFYITGIRAPTKDGFAFTRNRSGVALSPGNEDFVVGVFGPKLPTDGATLTISGPGISISKAQVEAKLFPGLVHIYALVNIATDAPPGLRSYILQKGSQVAYAPGYVEILPDAQDYNFDGLDDTFQRRHFDPFTSAAARPGADPDSDGFTNEEEAVLDSDPNDPDSIPVAPIIVEPFEVLSVALDASGSRVTFASVEGAKYQLFSRKNLRTGSWAPVGEMVTATGEITEILDPSATDEFEFYQVESVP